MAKMGLPEEPEDPLFAKHQQLVKELNLDEETASQAWASYLTTRTNYTLEGEDLHWLGCAVFVACRNTLTPTVSRNVVKGNPISLTCLLRFCGLSVAMFFHKINIWMAMTKLQEDEDFKGRVKWLEENFVITCNVYKEYFPIFEKIFKVPDMEAVRHRNRKQRPPPCTPTKVFEFTWLLFITVKGKHNSNDLVTAYYFLLACFDLVFKNAYLSNNRDLLNPNFDALPSNWALTTFQSDSEAPCIIDNLLMQRTGKLTDAVYVKEYTLKKYVQDLIVDGVLRGNSETLTGLLEPGNFECNYVNIARAYDQLILNEGNIDERIFLAESQRQYLLQSILASNGNSSMISQNELDDTTEDNSAKINSAGDIVQQCPQTPLTGRRYLRPRYQVDAVVANGSQSIARLQTILTGCTKEPSENLTNIFANCTENPREKIDGILERLNDKFWASYQSQIENVRPNASHSADSLVQLATTLFYKLLENMLANENINNLSPLVAKDIFHESLYTCCLEIVLFTYSSPTEFPWILDTLNIQAVNVVRIIELIVRSKDQLSRDTIKHLSYVEETMLESLMWKSESTLWEEIKKFGFPKFEDVALPTNVFHNNGSSSVDVRNQLPSPASTQSPSLSAVETFQSPINVQVKKQLFSNVKPGQSLLQNSRAVHLMFTDQDGNKKYIAIEHPPQPILPTVPIVTLPEKPKKVGSHFIICRKFYNLAGVRLDHLCNRLGISELDLKKKIWTVFEFSVKKNTDLLRDRHLDQLLMCAVYVICKITGNDEKNFSEIMRCYRVQPQANSDIYRNVLGNRAQEDSSGQIVPETRSSLIEFYNTIYVQYMKNFVVQFSKKQENSDILLSPLPSIKSLLVSPRQQIMKNVFVRPFESPNSANSPQSNSTSSYSYLFSRSASKDLNDINKAINGSCITGKRLLGDSFDIDLPNKRFRNRKMQALIEERKVQSME